MSETKQIDASWAGEDGSVVGFMCKIDWQYELGGANGGSRIFPSIDDLKKNHECWADCGVVRVKVTFDALEVPDKRPATPTPHEKG